jgi:hypothetical protein
VFKSYDEIFDAYVADLRIARDDALAWWAALKQRANSTPATDPDEARVRPRWPGGPTSHPRVQAVYRHYYLETHAYNERMTLLAQGEGAPGAEPKWGVEEPPSPAEDYELTPSALLIERLEEDAPDLDAFMNEMLMVPIEAPLGRDARRPEPGEGPAKFKFAIIHRVNVGIDRLMLSPRDLPQVAPWRDPPIGLAAAPTEFRALFLEYHRDLEAALRIAETWWTGVVARSSRGFFGRQSTAVTGAYENFFAGPASSPEFLWVLHHFWLRCVKLNEELPEPNRVPPEVVLLHWLRDGRHDSWIECITCLPYWPLGLDAAGKWV